MPIVEEAQRAFERQGLKVTLKRNWDGDLYTAPSIEFSVSGQKQRPYDASTYEVTGEKATVSHDGEKLTASIRNRKSQGMRKNDTGHDLDAVRRVLKTALETLYEDLLPER